ncbi:RICIN domain-containing protein [Actinoplanes rectilineatus]|uniref:RICIN domain-containing protein n=1 Tax=Actinoplanes rectilineatus TaxID=113571 RepID=UPI000A46191F|nr:RICIN domain-containing protein [Actinoplanes rectilineatus]
MGSVDGAPGDDVARDRDPLLVRPFVLKEGAGSDGARDGVPATWQDDPNREIPTQVLPAVAARGTAEEPVASARRHRPLLLIGAGVAVAVAVGGYAMLRPVLQPTTSSAMPGSSLPVVTGPAAASAAAAAATEDALGQEESEVLGNGGTSTQNGGSTSGSGSRTTGTAAPTTGAPSSGSTPSSGPAAATSSATTAPAGVAPTVVPSGEGSLVSGNKVCLDLRGGRAADRREVHVDTCNDSSPQQWRLNADRTLEVQDWCAAVSVDTTVRLTSCDGAGTNAQWQMNTDGVLTNVASGLCLTDPYAGTRTGKGVIVTLCLSTPNQRWTFS